MSLAVQMIDLPASPFTFFAPTEDAAVKLSSLLAAEGCQKVAAETVKQVWPAPRRAFPCLCPFKVLQLPNTTRSTAFTDRQANNTTTTA